MNFPLSAFSTLCLTLIVNSCLYAQQSARDHLVDLFKTYDLVALGESHWSAPNHDFLRELIRDPRLVDTGVRNVVVEFGNARYQSIADDYVGGKRVSINQVRKIWRDTTVIMAWDSPVYEEFFRTVREVNRTRPPNRRLRVLLGDPPIDWPNVKTKADYERFADRDLSFAAVVEADVLNWGEKALLIAGGTHFLNPREDRPDLPAKSRNAADLIRRRYPGRIFAIYNTQYIPTDKTLPWLLELRRSAFEHDSFAAFAPRGLSVPRMINGHKQWVTLVEEDWPQAIQMVDGLIYYGPDAQVAPRSETYRDREYVAELYRRAAIMTEVYGMDFTKQVDEAVAGAKAKDR